MTPDQVIALASAAGTLAAAIATFLTVGQIARQRRASYRPELAVLTFVFRAQPNDLKEGIDSPFATQWTGLDETKVEFQNVGVQLVNLGLASARNVTVEFSFSSEKSVLSMNRLAQELEMPMQWHTINGSLRLLSGRSEKVVRSVEAFRAKGTVDYVLPVTMQNTVASFRWPEAYSYIASVLAFLHLKGEPRFGVVLSFIPVLNVDVSFDDIAGERHRSRSECEFVLLLPELPDNRGGFSALLQPRRTSQITQRLAQGSKAP